VRSWEPTGPLSGFVCVRELLGPRGDHRPRRVRLVGRCGLRSRPCRQAVSDPIRLYALLGLDQTTWSMPGNAAGADDVADLEATADVVQSCAIRENPG